MVPYYSEVTGGGGGERGLSLLGGNRWSDGGVIFSYEHHQQQAVDASSRATLVPQALPFQVIPSQTRQGAVLNMHQELASWAALSADGLGSERSFAQRYPSGLPVSTQSQGRATMWSGNVDTVLKLPGEWRGHVIGAYAQERETVTASAATISQSFQTRATMTSVDWRGDGPVYKAAGGLVKLSLGAAWRRETFDNWEPNPSPTGGDLKRDVWGLYAEALVPFVSADNALPWAKRVELSLAVRHDDYRHGPTRVSHAVSDNPKIGLLWSPLPGLAWRGTYATSFRVAPLAQMNRSTDTALLLQLPNPSIPGTPINTAYITGGNNTLRPEVARSFTTGLDISPSSDTLFSATYFRLDYRNRIAAPPLVGEITSVYEQLDTLRPFINLSPSAADIQAVYDRYTVLDPANIGQGGLRAIFDSRLKNIAATQISGVAIVANSKIPTHVGEFNFQLQAQYLAQLNNQAAPTTPYVSALNTVFNPPKLRMQSGITWSQNGWTASTNLDFTGSYRDTLTAGAPNVASWLFVDCRLAYATDASFASTPLENTTVAVSVNNITNRSVPYVAGLAAQSLGYDSSHASPLGRVVLFMVRKHW
jgi:iron complex outermembrane receptor protein